MIPGISPTVDEMLNLKELAGDCAQYGMYEFIFFFGGGTDSLIAHNEDSMKFFSTFAKFFLSAFVISAAVPGSAIAQTYPDKPVRIIIPYTPGSAIDVVSRLIGGKLSTWWAQPVVVESRPGASGQIAVEATKRAPADGYTFIVVDASPMVAAPHLYKRLPYDPFKDFDAVAPVYATNFFVSVAFDSPWKNIPDLVAAAKAKNGALTYASAGIGSSAHFGGTIFESEIGAPMSHVAYKDLSQALMDISSGQVGWMFVSGASSQAMYQAKKIKYLAIAGPERNPNYPDVPTMAEAGGPAKFEMKDWGGLFAPRGLPQTIIDKVNADVARALREADVQQRMGNLGLRAWTGQPEDLRKAMVEKYAQNKVVVQRTKISLD